MLRLVLQQQRAHHRRQRQCDEAGDHHRTRERQREFDEQPTGATRRERQWREHGRTGRLFIEFALTLAGAVVVSGFIALTLSPMMCSILLKHETKHSWLYNTI